MTITYGVICLVSLLLIGACLAVDKKKNIWLLMLFVSIFVCNLGYFLVSAAKNLTFALVANSISYLGSVFLPFFMLLMILNLCRMNYPKWLPRILIAVGGAIFILTASPGISQLYYKTVSLDTTGSAAKLIREYGPLHCVYSVYLALYFAAMIGVVFFAIAKKKITNALHAIFMVVSVFGNIAIWLVEQFIPRNFEFLSISYIFTEVLILLMYGIMQEYASPCMIEETVLSAAPGTRASYMPSVGNDTGEAELFSPEQIELMISRCSESAQLTRREQEVMRLILGNRKRKDIAEELCITESTVKKYTSQIYRKLSVSSRIELFAKLKNQI